MTLNAIYFPFLATSTSDPRVGESSVSFPTDQAVQASAVRALGRGLCPECFGRLYGRLGHGLTNSARAQRLLDRLDTKDSPSEPCALCGGVFARLPVWVERARRATEGYECRRFTCGSRWDPELLAREEFLWTEVGTSWGESIRGAFNREFGKALQAATGAEGTTHAPDIVIVADISAGQVEREVLPLYLSGRYRKLDRTLPQTHWPCRRCHGRGCEYCGGTGKMYPTSVEELVAGPVLAVTGGSGSRFHGMGREDIDARMLGRGRPFIIEILRPKRRTPDPAKLEVMVNEATRDRVEVQELAFAQPEDVIRLKEAAPEKSYRVVVLGEVPREKVNEALTFAAGRAIAQRTPTRVAHRRSDRVRQRRIVQARLVEAAPGRFTLDLRTEAGTYVKEWVEGDGGRTEPSLSGLLGTPLKVEQLDVLEIHYPRE